MIDMPYAGMVLHFKSTGIEYKIISVSSEYKWIDMEIISFGEFEGPNLVVGRKGRISHEDFIFMQQKDYVRISLPARPAFEVLT
jgi:hypothetical protein